MAIILCGIYTILWCWMGQIAYYDFTHHGDGETIGLSLYYFAFIVILPYFLTTVAFAVFSTKLKKFYWNMVGFILVFIPVAALIGFLVNYING
ncbi:hypothetical protein NAF17_17065 [Mucilaginibacter sp. RB4R14]|uniref:hypothetical protein n=1 Tax=Mucilaginibacter aurantiaciroseus TaxID=2949308 RepID=UPI0020918AA3|nr:hypothetical protein [Mucilaginibacter aurantiaciroseus]MCO5937260.1 hypothetical protein [Mucilaginibacter aurantiaciroseus]